MSARRIPPEVVDLDRESLTGDGLPPTDDEVEELLDDLIDLKESTDSAAERRLLRRTIRTLDRLSGGRIFGLRDLAQQIVGGFVLSAPFVVTGEVWDLAAGMTWWQGLLTFVMVVVIGYGALYRAIDTRHPEREILIAGLPLRFISLITISYLSVTILVFLFNAPTTFGATTETTLKAISVSAIFGVVGAATADSLFR
jgi:uncharacterized membrane protein